MTYIYKLFKPLTIEFDLTYYEINSTFTLHCLTHLIQFVLNLLIIIIFIIII